MSLRFACAYFGLYFASFPLGLLPWDWPAEQYTKLWRSFVPWVGAHVLHLAQPITVFPLGSGDTTYNYVEVLCFAVLALSATLVWSLAAWRAPHHRRAHALLHTGLRFAVGMTLMGYGMAKVIPTQFPFPGLERLSQSYGDSSPMGLLWTFMGFSSGYNLFAGVCETLPGVLLFYRRTATLGALLGAGVMANIVALNFCYDVPVKLYSAHLFAACAFLALPDAARLWSVLVANRPTASVARRALPWRWAERLRPWVVTAFLGYVFYGQITGGLEGYRIYGAGRPTNALCGVYEVLAFERDGAALEPSDDARWQRVTFNAYGGCTVSLASGNQLAWSYERGAAGATVKLTAGTGGQVNELETVWNDPEHLDLAGDLGGALVVAQMKKKTFLLQSRGFHWVNETPFNR
ncbi:MAG: hypothetical protein EXS08_02205 [Planctomycetes bacterium]|nr:hypothetical protein [Planctomycetota bacterium]